MRVKCASLDICCDSNCSGNPSDSRERILRAIRAVSVFMAYSTKVLIAAWQMSFECSQPEWSGHSQKRDFKRRWTGTHTQHTRHWGMLMLASLQLVLCSALLRGSCCSTTTPTCVACKEFPINFNWHAINIKWEWLGWKSDWEIGWEISRFPFYLSHAKRHSKNVCA